MRWIVTTLLAILVAAVLSSCCCSSFRQGFQQGLQQAQQETTTTSSTSEGSDTGTVDEPGDDSGSAESPRINILDDQSGSGSDGVEGYSGDIELVDLTVGDAIDPETNEITSEIDIFWPSDPTMHISAVLLNAPAGTVVTAELVGESLEVDGDVVQEEPLSSLDLVAEGVEEFHLFYDFSAPDSGWWLGDYRCDLYIDGMYADTISMVTVPEGEMPGM